MRRFLPIGGLTGSYQGITNLKPIAFERPLDYTLASFENTFTKQSDENKLGGKREGLDIFYTARPYQ